MNTKHHVSQTIAKQLAEAGIVIESEYGWVGFINDNGGEYFEVRHERDSYPPRYPAPIATEILERLPKQVEINGEMCWLQATLAGQNPTVYYGKDSGHALVWKDDMYSEYAPTLPDALAHLLIRLTKDGLI